MLQSESLQDEDMRDLREKYGYTADMSDDMFIDKLKEYKEHLKRDIRKVSHEPGALLFCLTH